MLTHFWVGEGKFLTILVEGITLPILMLDGSYILTVIGLDSFYLPQGKLVICRLGSVCKPRRIPISLIVSFGSKFLMRIKIIIIVFVFFELKIDGCDIN